MGAGSSHDEAHNQGPTHNNTSDGNNTNPKPKQSIKQVPLPHNCEDILKHADSPVERSSTKKLLEQLHAGVFLNQKTKKYWVEEESNRNCFFLFARYLSITWAEDNRFWCWPLDDLSKECLPVAELLNVCWLEVHGKIEAANLSPETTYEIVFVLNIKDSAYGWNVPVNLRLTLPDGTKQEHKVNLMEKPKGQWIEIPAGEFKSSTKKVGEIQFSLYEYEGGKWKKGLVIKGVSIRPKNSVM